MFSSGAGWGNRIPWKANVPTDVVEDQRRKDKHMARGNRKVEDGGCESLRVERSPDQEIGAFDLRYFPRDGHDRFVTSVSRGKNTMPAWGDSLTAADIEALWAYVCGGEN